jgi:hypothetical protein
MMIEIRLDVLLRRKLHTVTDPLLEDSMACHHLKCVIFCRFDFCYFYTIKPLWVGDFGKKYRLIL